MIPDFPLQPNWHVEWNTRDDFHIWGMGETLVSTKTQFQEVVIAEAVALGRCLLLDDRVQSAQIDEWIYHEALVHPVLTVHPSPRQVLVLGGGEGATVREVLRHPSVESVTMVDIDGDLVEFCREHLPDWHQGAFDDPRCRLLIGDAKVFLRETDETFDVIIADLTDPIEEGLASLLYTRQFYSLLKPRLSPDGLFVTQALGIRYNRLDVLHAAIHSTLRTLFGHVSSYSEFMPTFDSLWAFIAASDVHDIAAAEAEHLDQRLAERGLSDLRFYDGLSHRRLVAVPRHLRRLIAETTQVIEEDEPIAVEW